MIFFDYNLSNYLNQIDFKRKQIIEEMAKCSAWIFPSFWFEGIPMTTIESFSTKTPVLASNLGTMPVMIQNEYNGLLFEPNKSNSLHDAVKTWNALSDEVKFNMRENCYYDFELKYSFKSNFEQLKQIYKSAVNE